MLRVIQKYQSRKENLLPTLLSFFIMGSIACLFWPGYMSPDSIGQLNQGLSGNYSDHHPPMMSFFWRIFSFISEGPQVYLVFHLFLLFGSILLLQSMARQTWLKIGIALIPLIPNIFAYTGALWKDVGFAYAFLLAAVILAKSNITGQKLTLLKVVAILSLLIYGVGVKYQAQFVLPVICCWLGVTLAGLKFNFKAVFIGFMAALFIQLFVVGFNKTLVPVEKEQHSWQMVKLYDLAGISLRVGENLFPESVTSDENFSMESVRNLYSSERVDEMIKNWYPTAPLALAKNEVERTLIWNTWAAAVINHPLAYFAHRFGLWRTMVSKSPVKPVDELAGYDQIPENIKMILNHGGTSFLLLVRELSRFYLMIPFLFFYIGWGFYLYRRGNPAGLTLMMMNLAGVSLMLCLFVFSMAADMRYIYLTTCCLFFSHPLALMVFLKTKRTRLLREGGNIGYGALTQSVNSPLTMG